MLHPVRDTRLHRNTTDHSDEQAPQDVGVGGALASVEHKL